MDIRVGDTIKMKKQHPCGSFEWEVLRIGIDFRLKCAGCGHMIMVPRKQAEKTVKRVLRNGEELKPEQLTGNQSSIKVEQSSGEI